MEPLSLFPLYRSEGNMKAPSVRDAVLERVVCSSFPTLFTITIVDLSIKVVEVGKAMIDRCPGPHLTFVDTRLHDDTPAIIASAGRLVMMFRESGIGRENIIVSVRCRVLIIGDLRISFMYDADPGDAARYTGCKRARRCRGLDQPRLCEWDRACYRVPVCTRDYGFDDGRPGK